MRRLRKHAMPGIFNGKSNTNNSSIDGAMANYLFFIFNDMAETTQMVSEEQNSLHINGYSNYVKNLVNTLKYTNKDLRKFVSNTSAQTQEEFGNTADSILKLVLYFVDRCGDSEEKYNNVINYIKSMDSEVRLDLRKFGIYDE